MGPFLNTDYRYISLFKKVSREEWNDWKWQFRNVIRDIPTLKKVIHLGKKEEEDLVTCLKKFKMAITPYYASLMDKKYKRCVIRLQAVPRVQETEDTIEDVDDPLDEDVDSPVPGLTHRYPDRVLFLITHICSMYCRHCTRRRVVGVEDANFTKKTVDLGLDYIRATPSIKDVLLSGGDPLVLADDRIEYVLKELRAIPHVDIIRIGSRMPVVLPQRITEDFAEMLKKYHPIYLNTHFNHSREITRESKEACERLANVGIPLGNQSVLLRDVNDCPYIMKQLVQKLLAIRVKPYYIYQCDLSKGISHFRTSITKGMEIIENLRGHTTGMAIPTFVVDAPGGGGKIPLMPNYLLSQSDKRLVFRNYEGVITTYTQPDNVFSDCGRCHICDNEQYKPLDGVAKLLSGEKLYLEPEGLVRRKR
ncbi:MAG: lysine 2,3-aminomutase [Deltaproteobacteria bacterium]|nr:lysine 2,3-aminomutase [Deltaproteobacteria bacterium]MBT7711713.1 lysine 2,3-aminomutase [Deltaproteobacteria bacterium]